MNVNTRRQFIIICIAFLCINSVKGQQQFSPEKLGWNSFTLKNDTLGAINYYVTSNKIDAKKPLLLFLDGSGAYPLFQYTENGTASTISLDYKKWSGKYHIVVISKPGVPFADSVGRRPSGEPVYMAPAEYKKRLSLQWRVNSAKVVLAEMLKQNNIIRKKIIVIGISEGFQVGSKLLTVCPEITHAVLLVGNGLNQFFDFIIHNRIAARTGKLSEEQAQKNIDSLTAVAGNINENANSTEKEWYGHTYLRWSSFCNSTPMDDILSVNIPVYIIVASKDDNTTVLSTDYLFLESIKRKRKNIIYKVYPYDHSLTEKITDDHGKVVALKNRSREIISEVILLLEKQ